METQKYYYEYESPAQTKVVDEPAVVPSTPGTPRQGFALIPMIIGLIILALLVAVGLAAYLNRPDSFASCVTFPGSRVEGTTCRTFYGAEFTRTPETTRNPGDIIESWETYVNEQYTYAIDYPTSWTVQETEVGTVFSNQSLEATESGSFKTILIEVENNPQGLSADQFVDQILTATDSAQPTPLAEDSQIMDGIRRESIQVAGTTGEQVIGLPSQNGALRVYVPHQGRMFVFSYQPLSAQDFEAAREEAAIFYQMLSSFTFDPSRNIQPSPSPTSPTGQAPSGQVSPEQTNRATPTPKPTTKGGQPQPATPPTNKPQAQDVSTWTKHRYPTENLIIYAPGEWQSKITDFVDTGITLIRFWKSGSATNSPITLEIKPNWQGLEAIKGQPKNFQVANSLQAIKQEQEGKTVVYFERSGQVYVFTCGGNNWNLCYTMLQTMEFK